MALWLHQGIMPLHTVMGGRISQHGRVDAACSGGLDFLGALHTVRCQIRCQSHSRAVASSFSSKVPGALGSIAYREKARM